MHLYVCRCMPKALGTCLLGAQTWTRRAVCKYTHMCTHTHVHTDIYMLTYVHTYLKTQRIK